MRFSASFVGFRALTASLVTTALLALLVGAAPAGADSVPHPLLWHVRTKTGDAYLFGSIHVLPPHVAWRTRAIARAIRKSDVFVFEVPEDAPAVAELRSLIEAHGYLPPGQSLRDELEPTAQAAFDAALKTSGLQLAAIDHDRPWLAGLQLMFAEIAREKFAAGNGVDVSLMAEAEEKHKQMRYLETIEQQFALLAPQDGKLELEEFESGLKDLGDVDTQIQPMLEAWLSGDQLKLDTLINGDLDDYPDARKMLLDDRNQRWVGQIASMLNEKHTFFITVGAGHLIGAKGLPALLRSAGFKVEGP